MNQNLYGTSYPFCNFSHTHTHTLTHSYTHSHTHTHTQPRCSTVTCRITCSLRTSCERTATPGPQLKLERLPSTETAVSSRARFGQWGPMPWSIGVAGVARCSLSITVDSIRGSRSVSITMGDWSRIKVGGASGCGLTSQQYNIIRGSRSLPINCFLYILVIEYGEGVVSKYTCCQGRRDSAGCQVAKVHCVLINPKLGVPHNNLSLSLSSFMLQLVSVPH